MNLIKFECGYCGLKSEINIEDCITDSNEETIDDDELIELIEENEECEHCKIDGNLRRVI